ncbi:MAG: hypothetical protein L7H09_05505 [Acidilobus sp.]|nr:hypothetical protein [Acidilobus sp.]
MEQRRTKSGQVYYIAWHYLRDENGQRTVKKCYLGPRTYRHGQVTHQPTGLQLKGMIEDLQDMPRLSDYLRGVAQTLRQRIEDRSLPSIHARAIAQALEELAALIEPLRKYAEEKAKEEAELAEATAEAVNVTAPRQAAETPPVTSQPQTTEAGQDKADAYRALTALTGLPPEDIERQLAKLKEALKELKASR